MPDSTKLQELRNLLYELFQIDDAAELDFGIYRIMATRRHEIKTFLDEDLFPQVSQLLSSQQGTDRSRLEQELIEKTEAARKLGADPENLPAVLELRARLQALGTAAQLEDDVFSALSQFFKRYYHNGDFISLRRYNKGVYAIPYEGEEVKLHWANADQYYIKTAEQFTNYTFTAANSRVHFRIVQADTERDNVKAEKGRERKFALHLTEPLVSLDGEPAFQFTYAVRDEKTNPVEDVLKWVNANLTLFDTHHWQNIRADLLAKAPTDKNKDRTVLEKHLTRYIGKNTFDYFIHKDLGGFLRRELDFYIKNEILFIDDLDARNEAGFLDQLGKIKVIKTIGHKIIAFLEQLENFQKKLFLKKKFVVESNWCFTLDRVPESLYPAIIANTAQTEEWKKLFHIHEITGADEEAPAKKKKDSAQQGMFADEEQTEADVPVAFSEPLTEAFLRQNPFLVLDTKFFDEAFKDKLLQGVDNLDEQRDGLLVHGDNFQGLGIIQKRYCNEVKCIYIDPPYNTESDRTQGKFIYKDNFAHSSYLSMMYDRVEKIYSFLSDDSVFFCSCDRNELSNLKLLFDSVFDKQNFVEIFSWIRSYNPPNLSQKSRQKSEYVICYEKYRNNNKYSGDKIDKQDSQPLYNAGNTIGVLNFPSSSVSFNFEDVVIPPGEYGKGPITLLNELIIKDGKNQNDFSLSGPFRWKQGTLDREISTGTLLRIATSSNLQPRFQRNVTDTAKVPDNIILSKAEGVFSNEEAKDHLESIINKSEFDYPKPISLVQYLISFQSSGRDIIMDCFGGSGTTGHAIIESNRQNKSNNLRYVLIEMGDHFDTVLKPRIQKVIYSSDWKEGKPVTRHTGISHSFQYIRLESYEDTLNNLTLTPLSSSQQQTLLENDEFREDYFLNYLLNLESRGSLLDSSIFGKPFTQQLRILRNGVEEAQTIDLPETFNWLLGLRVTTRDRRRDFLEITGIAPNGDRVLIIWRDCEISNSEALDNFFVRMRRNPKDNDFDRIYVNGDNNLENQKTADDRWKVLLIEQEFLKLMFENC